MNVEQEYAQIGTLATVDVHENTTDTVAYECGNCGAVVSNREQHDRFHHALRVG